MTREPLSKRLQLDYWDDSEYCKKLAKRWGNYDTFCNIKSKAPVIAAITKVCGRVSRITKQPPSVLEIGCGAGHFMYAIRDFVSLLVGIDQSRPMLAMCKKEFRKRKLKCMLLHGSCWRLPLPDNYVDISYQVDVCMHVGGSYDSLCEAMRVSKRAVVFTGPSFESDMRNMDEPIKGRHAAWAISKPLLENKLLDLHRAGIISNFMYMPRRSTRVYKHRILVIYLNYVEGDSGI